MAKLSGPGDRLLVHGAAGGVGTALLELGRLAGLETYGTASRRHHELVASLGATPIDYRAEDFLARIRSLTGGGVDVVVDTVGGARHLWRSYPAFRAGGRLVRLGAAATKRVHIRDQIPGLSWHPAFTSVAEFRPTHLPHVTRDRAAATG